MREQFSLPLGYYDDELRASSNPSGQEHSTLALGNDKLSRAPQPSRGTLYQSDNGKKKRNEEPIMDKQCISLFHS
jgi:hypothetical protein